MEEPSIPDDIDATLRGDAVDDDKLAEEPEPSPLPIVEAAVKKGKPRARRVVPPLSPRRTRARSRSLSVDQPDIAPIASRTTRSKSKALAGAAAAAPAVLVPVSESQVFDEFVADSDDDEVEMHEVEDNLKISMQSRGALLSQIWLYFVMLLLARCADMNGNYTTGLPAEDLVHNSQTAKDLFTSGRMHAESNDAGFIDLSQDDSDGSGSGSGSDDSDDAELLAYAEKLNAHVPPAPTASQNKGGKGGRNRDRESPSEETFPSPGTRAGAEKKRLTQAAKTAPYIPPVGTRALAMVEKERARVRQAAAMAVRRR